MRYLSRQNIALLALVACIAGIAVVVTTRWESNGDRPTWLQNYTCENGHTWQGDLAGRPTCPQCGKPAIRHNKYICPKCRKVFLGYDSRKIDVGQFEYRLPGADEWTRTGPDSIECPECKHADNPWEFPKPRHDQDPPIGTVIEDGKTPPPVFDQ